MASFNKIYSEQIHEIKWYRLVSNLINPKSEDIKKEEVFALVDNNTVPNDYNKVIKRD